MLYLLLTRIHMRSPQSGDALVRLHWPHLLPFFHTDPNALFRLRVVHDEVPKMQCAREEAPLIDAFKDLSLTIELWHPEHELIAMGRVPLDGGARWAHFANRKHALQLENPHPFPFSMEEWADCYLMVELREGRWEKLWHIVPHFQERKVEPAQPLFRATPGEESWQERLSGIADLETQLPHLSVEDGLLEGGELVLALTIDCVFPTSRYGPPLSEFRQCYLVLEVLGANGRVVAFHVSDVVIEPTGKGEADEKGDGDASYAMPALFILQGAPSQWVAGAEPLTAFSSSTPQTLPSPRSLGARAGGAVLRERSLPG